MILGVSGTNGAGKGEILGFLRARSFQAVSLSDVIRDELRSRGLEETRERMIETGNELREREGAGALAVRLFSQIAGDRDYAVDSIRHPAEVEALRARSARFRLIWVDADPEVRFQRIRARGRPGDPDSLERMQSLESRELGSANPAAQQLHAVRDLADYSLRNDGCLEGLHEAIQEVLRDCLYFDRPS